MSENEITIPEELQQVCRDISDVARKHGLLKLSCNFDPSNMHHNWRGQISFSWEQGRHGEDANQLKITSQFYVHTQINLPVKNEGDKK